MKINSSIILILLSVGLFYTFTNSQYQEVKRLNGLASEYRNVLKSVSNTVELRDNLLAQYSAISEVEIDRMNKLLPDHIDNVQLALDLDSMASKHGLTIKNFKVLDVTNNNATSVVLPENEKPYDKAEISFSFISNYDNFIRFLTDIERSLRIMDVRSISFRAGESSLYEYQISAETYWLK